MNISYEYYRIFYYVAKYKSFTKAANILMNNQPNVTRSIHNLEHQLGCRLFIRSSRGVTLTPEGEQLYPRVAAAVTQLLAGEEELLKSKSLHSGLVTIGASEIALHGLLLKKLREFHSRHPGIRIRISNHTTPQAIAALQSGLVDFSVVTTPTGVSKPLEETPLKAFQEILTGGPGYAYLAAQTWHLRDLKEHSFICMDAKSKTYEFYNQYFIEEHLPLEPDMEAATTDQVLLMIKNDLGIGFLPRDLADEALAHKEIFRIPLYREPPARHICLIQDRERPLSIAAIAMKEILLSMQDC
ncbi:LysR family transcriptional regulator [Lactonifactor longoviformis]|uniref:LysR family transcriptional regulator n=1 Tax=Lactonifactor longoviformis TaxID=341220 RepID=UPI001D00495C|nr:LysR family transcriptional regulator [Lactonifactor longoviformis]MCB5711338.1 LysR family transcriptional regulator [Lactonifactor longoviformis]MCB5715305.1 LysR family transcriptional regulator [Lactonifactor longoviformis]